MTQEGNNSEKKWQKVLKFLAAYLVAAWTFLQFVDWALVRYNISPYWVDMLLWIFIGVIPSLSIYLYNKERINKKILKLREKIIFPLNGLVVALVLFFGFGNSDLGSTTKDVSYTDDLGELQTATITKEEFRVGAPIYNFQQKSKDSVNSWLGNTINKLLELDLKQDKNISSEACYAENTIDKIKSSSVFNKYYVDGSYELNNGTYSITPVIHNSKNGKEISKKTFTGSDFFELIDQISIYIKDNVGIVEEMRDRYIDLSIKEMTTESMEALKAWANKDYDEAVKKDSSFTLAYFYNAVRRNRFSHGELEEKYLIDKAYDLKNNLPIQSQFEILMYKHIIYNRWSDAEELIKYQLEIEPNNEDFNRLLEMVFSETQNIEGYYKHALKRFDKSKNEDNARSYYMSLILNEKYDEAINLIKAYELLSPNTEEVQRIKAYSYLAAGRIGEAKKIYSKIKLTWPEESIYQKTIDDYIDKKQNKTLNFDNESFNGIYRSTASEQEVNYFEKGNTHFLHYKNQLLNKAFVYDTNVLLSFDAGWVSGTKHVFQKDSLGKVYRVKVDQFNRNRLSNFYYYAETNEITEAYNLLKSHQYENLDKVFESLILKYPEHWFLKDALTHILYRNNIEKEGLLEQFENIAGTYGARKFWVEKGKLFYKRDNLPKVELYPIAKNRYINLSNYETHYGFETNDNQRMASFSWSFDVEKQKWIKADNDTNYLLKN
ncbi:tetratricopeptide repeat protein [Tenacibaculum sp. MEBiC06402]|uniref:tetratricopeptide repeat protein n=1 Tax=unclassified Tenacibaculum TaxID=2635139 RepID=UPI003B9C8CB9